METLASNLKSGLADEGYGQVREVIIEQGPDSTGEESLFVWLLLDNKVSDKDLNLEKVESLLSAAREQMRRLQPQFYPYVRVRRQREWQQLQEQELTAS